MIYKKWKLYTLYSESHKTLFDNWFLKTLKDDFEINSKIVPQHCISACFMQPGWVQAVSEKIKFILEIIDQTPDNEYFIFSDVDIQWFCSANNKLNEIIKEHPDVDIFFQEDAFNEFCTGFFVCKANSLTKSFWKIILDHMTTNKVGDQRAVKNILERNIFPNIKVKHLPKQFWGPGHQQKNSNLWEPGEGLYVPQDIIFHHANWTVGIENKIDQFKYVKKMVDKSRNHIIVLPYWSTKEINNFLQVLRRWELFCQTPVKYSFLLTRRFDTPENFELIKICEKYASTNSIICDKYQWSGWPAGANGMFKNTLEYIFENEEKDNGFVFWYEHDVIPIYIDWLTWLDKIWNPELSLAGQFMSMPWINLHQVPMQPNINGTAMYNKSIAANQAFKEITSEKCFDFTLSELLPKYGGKTLPLPLLYDIWFLMPDWVKRCDLNKLMINGIKEINQREIIIQYILKNRDV